MTTPLLSDLRVTINGFTADCSSRFAPSEIRGLDDNPEVRATDSPRPQGHGDHSGTDWMGPRFVEVDLSGVIELGSDLTEDGSLMHLRRALRIGPGELVVEGLAGLPPLLLRGKVRRASIPTDRDLAFGVARPAFQFYCPDPLRYAARETVVNLDLREVSATTTTYASPVTYDAPVPYSGASGDASGDALVYLTLPTSLPARLGGRAGLIVSLGARNAGIYATAPLVRIYGPCPPFSLLQATTNRTWRYLVPVAAEDFLEIDMASHTVLLNGQQSRRQHMRGAWWDLQPGDNAVAFQPTDAAVGARLELRFRSAY